jgi:hypothetical protein
MGAQSSRIGDRLRAELGNVVKALILEIDANLRASPDQGGTPVDTGHARASWTPGISSPPDAVSSNAGDGTHDAGVAKLLAYKLSDGPAYESNHTPYINSLNYGHSKQAPRLFIEAAVDKAVATIQARYNARIDVTTLNELRGALAVGRAFMAFQ